jgi:colanic acid/amylovoran biosynthesis glycosyltransferase
MRAAESLGIIMAQNRIAGGIGILGPNAIEAAASNGGGARTGVQKKGNIVVVQGGFPALSATFILDQMTGLIKRGYEVETWATYDPQEPLIHPETEKYQLLEKTRYIKIPTTLFCIYPKIWVKRFLHINNIKTLSNVDAFHVNYGANFNLIKPIFQYYNTFVLVSFHGYDASRYFQQKSSSCYDYLFERANLITSPSYHIRSILLQKGCPSEKMKVHRCGLNLRFFQPKPTNYKKEQIILLTVARLVEKKGIEYSLKALSKIKEKYKLRYRIVGDGPLKSDLEKLVRRLGLENQVEFLGALDKEGVVQQMSEADIFVLTSVTAGDGDQEGLPVSLIEAQAMGLPVVSSYHTGIPELIADGQTGLLAKEKDTEKIAEHLATLVRNHELRLTFGQKARERVKKEFDLAALNDELADYFSSGIK